MKRTLMLLLLCVANSVHGNSIFDDLGIVFSKAETINEYTTRIPFQLIDNLIVVEAELMNKKGNFIIDTGSETLILNKNHFKEFTFINRKKEASSGVLDIVDGAIERRLNSFILSDFDLKNKQSDIFDLSHIEFNKKIRLLGIIGYNILKDYEVFIDTYLNQITLTKTDKYGDKLSKKVYLEKIVDSVDFTLKKHTIVVSAFVNDQKLRFGLDTAAEFNQINKSVKRKVLKKFYPTQPITLTGASEREIEVLAGKLYGVKLNETIYFGPMNTIITNLQRMNDAFGTSLDGILGFEFFKQKRTIINYKKEKLYFIDFPFIYKQ